ncbi:MAG: acyltransferase [bacterium]
MKDIKTKNKFSIIFEVGLKTIYFNFKYLPLRQAVKLPILVSRRVYLRKLSGVVEINGPVHTGMIKIGFNSVGIFDHKRSRSIWQVSGKVVFNGRASIGHGSKISVDVNGVLIMGNNFIITAESTIIANNRDITFGDDCLISWDVLIMDTDFHLIYNAEGVVLNEPRPIKVGSHVWIGCRSMVLKGAEIPSHSVIAANSLVSKPLRGKCKVFAGQPVIEIKNNVTWKK